MKDEKTISEKRSALDVLGLFAAGLILVLALFGLSWFLDEKLHLSHRWWLFVTGNSFVFLGLLWRLRKYLRESKAAAIILIWIAAHISIAFLAVRAGTSNFATFISIPVEAFIIVILIHRVPRTSN